MRKVRLAPQGWASGRSPVDPTRKIRSLAEKLEDASNGGEVAPSLLRTAGKIFIEPGASEFARAFELSESLLEL
jgi:hypothetical protein